MTEVEIVVGMTKVGHWEDLEKGKIGKMNAGRFLGNFGDGKLVTRNDLWKVKIGRANAERLLREFG